MASLCGRILLQVSRRSINTSVRCGTKVPEMADPLDHATGLEKKELLARAAGNDDPFDMKVIKRGPGTKDCPNEVPSAFDSRLVGCICEEDATSINWMWLHQGSPRRCECGHWFKLIEKTPL
ncbi:cytochrome c oxidase subunit 5B, mitochondrial [Neodiprion pinetum]|uniref:Cytochrome c oxidase subunit 5B, mitochondrial n=1 Tax=Neodiprion lecontei TaxID=441921 RepID=A0A6J0CD97_NEOLC|nr:cytochrome c oxidase subunit 5B, mitochondrial [Neodiprion lecontei]XP_046410074.1 cytochrome c oxidase subunit 5B, mitochondrial-like [Neodiprion fabricii]XP_046467209.1 cytochrome c oxidase subunit 5B, mitochondrial-like [Neodiprion pinetum]XP_046606499.1 cytochrome c oxidase subunit 5B, mitochondrial-like [Neodiprion virginianus]